MYSYNYTYTTPTPTYSSPLNVTVYNPNVLSATPTVTPIELPSATISLNNTFYTNIDYNKYYYPIPIFSDNNYREIISLIPIKMNKIIPSGSVDIITYEYINNDDIIIDFKRDSKTEFEHGAYYKESSFINIFKENKNPFTMLPLDANSIVKYLVKFEN